MFIVTLIFKEVLNIYKDISVMDKNRDVMRISNEGLNVKDSIFGICKGSSSCLNTITNK